MPRIKSAIKRVEVAKRNQERNKPWKSAVRTARTTVADCIKSSEATEANSKLQNLYSIVDRAVAKGVLHKNSAARKKSRLAKLVQKLSSGAK